MVRDDLPGVSAKEKVVQICRIRARSLRRRCVLIVEGVLDVRVVSRTGGFVVASDGLFGENLSVSRPIKLVPTKAWLRVVGEVELVKRIVNWFIVRLSRSTNVDCFRHEDDRDSVAVLRLANQFFSGQQRVEIGETKSRENGLLLA